MKLLKWLGLSLALGSVVALPKAASAEEITLKFATLAPDGSSWMKLLKATAKEIQEETTKATAGKWTVKTKYFAGGSAGDEKGVIRKIRGGSLDGAAVTAVGLGMIQPEVRVQELPGLLQAGNSKQLDCVRGKLAPDFEAKFLEKGYVLLGWGDVGWVHIFTNTKIASMAELRAQKFWSWTDDAIITTLLSTMNLHGEGLGVPGVLPALQTGKINAIYSSPLGTVALQWYTKVKYMTKEPVGVAVGAIMMSKATWDKLPPEVQTVIRAKMKELETKLKNVVRKDNDKAIKALQKGGIELVDIPADVKAELTAAGPKVAATLQGKIYSKELLEKVRAMAAVCK